MNSWITSQNHANLSSFQKTSSIETQSNSWIQSNPLNPLKDSIYKSQTSNQNKNFENQSSETNKAVTSLSEKFFDRSIWLLESILDLYTKIVHYQDMYHPAYNRRFGGRFGTNGSRLDGEIDGQVAYGTLTYRLQDKLHRFIHNFSSYKDYWILRLKTIWNSYSTQYTRFIASFSAFLASLLLLFWKYKYLQAIWKQRGTFNPVYIHEPTFAIEQTIQEARKQNLQIRNSIPEGWRRTFFGYEMSQEERRMDLKMDEKGQIIGLKRFGQDNLE